MKASVIVFPGSNCDRDVKVAFEAVGADVSMVWHDGHDLPESDIVVVPGGFSYGDYLRCGAMAAHSPVMREVKAHAEKGGYVLGICNGFQILTESGLLPGTLMQNSSLKFICKDVHLKVENTGGAFTSGYEKDSTIRIPIAHHEGNFFATQDALKAIEDNGQVAFRYADAAGAVNDNANPNGSLNNIAGIYNKQGNVLGLMPHPERLWEPGLGGTDGRVMFDSLLAHFG